jgi:hypothetical protein
MGNANKSRKGVRREPLGSPQARFLEGDLPRRPACKLQSSAPDKVQDHQNGQSYSADGIKVPFPIVRPHRKRGHKDH